MEWECCEEYDRLVWSASLQCMCLWMALYRTLCTACVPLCVWRAISEPDCPFPLSVAHWTWPSDSGLWWCTGTIRYDGAFESKGKQLVVYKWFPIYAAQVPCVARRSGFALTKGALEVHNYFSVHLLTEKHALCPTIIFSFAAVLTLVRLLVAWVTLS